MAKTKSALNQRKFWIVILLLLVFSAGFLAARIKYKPQIKTSYDMIMEREAIIEDLKSKIKSYEDKMMMETQF